MGDVGAPECKKSGWSQEEKYNFALAIIKQLSDNGSNAPKMPSLEIPGRTVKALSHQWQAMKKDFSRFPTAEEDGSGDTIPKVAAAKGGKRKGKPEGDENGGAEEPTKKKRAAPAKKTTAKKSAAATKGAAATDVGKDSQESDDGKTLSEDEEDVKPKKKAPVKKAVAKKKTAGSASGGEGEKDKLSVKAQAKKKPAAAKKGAQKAKVPEADEDAELESIHEESGDDEATVAVDQINSQDLEA